MELVPLKNECQRTPRELPCHDAILDSDGNLKLAIGGVEVWRHVVSIEHGDHDTEEATELRHKSILALEASGSCTHNAARNPRRAGARAWPYGSASGPPAGSRAC